MRALWCKWFHRRYHQRIGRTVPFYSYVWCWMCEEDVK